jgi:hypothetical protein
LSILEGTFLLPPCSSLYFTSSEKKKKAVCDREGFEGRVGGAWKAGYNNRRHDVIVRGKVFLFFFFLK